MAEAATIARPYAKAAFMAARDAKALPAWSAALQLGSAMMADPRVADLVTNPKLGLDQLVTLFAGLAGTGDTDAHWQNFVRLLATNKRLEVFRDIAALFELLRAQYENELDVQVTSAVAMNAEEQAGMVAALKKRFRRDVRMSLAVDSSLLGGAVIRAGDLVIDGSMRGRLDRLASDLGG